MPIKVGEIREFRSISHGFKYEIKEIEKQYGTVIVKILEKWGKSNAGVGLTYRFSIEETEKEKIIKKAPAIIPKANFTAKNKTKMEIKIKKCQN